jgi:formate dehydrogenase subunit delta
MSGGGTVEHLTQMANDIGAYFRSEPDHELAVKGVQGHIQKFWTPRMRQKIVEHLACGGEGLEDLPLEAVRRLAAG